MKRIMLLLLSIGMTLTGCGSATAAATEESAAITEVVTEEKAEEVTEESAEKETDGVQVKYADGELQSIKLNIKYNSDASYQSMFFYLEKDNDHHYFSGDLIENGERKSGLEVMGENGRNEIIFSGETAEKADAAFNSVYETFVEPNKEVIDGAFLELAQRSADEMGAPSASDVGQLTDMDITDKMPDKLSLTIDKAEYEIDVAKITVSGEGFDSAGASPENAAIPGWVDDTDKYRYLNDITVWIKVPIEQLSPLYEFYEAVQEEELPKTEDTGKADEKNSGEKNAGAKNTDEKNVDTGKAAGEETEKPDASADLIGTWYDPTGYNTATFTFNADGTGTINWGSSTDNLTYSVSGNTINVVLPNNTNTSLTIGVNCLNYGGSKYVKR